MENRHQLTEQDRTRLSHLQSSIESWKKGAAKYDLESLYSLGTACYYGNAFIDVDYKEAMRLFLACIWEQESIRDPGFTSKASMASYLVGLMLYNGAEGISQEPEGGYLYIERAARQGLLKAVAWISEYHTGDEQRPLPFPRNPFASFVMIEGIARSGNRDAVACLAQHYDFGWGVAQDRQRAKQLYEDAANKGSSEAMYSMGLILHDEMNYKLAGLWFEKAAQMGYAPAIDVLNSSYTKTVFGAWSVRS